MTDNAPGHPLNDAAGLGEDAADERDSNAFALRVLWTGTAEARDLARVLGEGVAHQAGTNVVASCVKARATLLVAPAITSFELCSMAVPYGFTSSKTRLVVAAVGGGPHTLLAAHLAHRLSRQLGVPAFAVCGYGPSGLRAEAEGVLAEIADRLPDLAVQAVQTPRPAAIVEGLPAGTLVVVGAPGGNWLERRFFGPGARIRARAPDGVIVVKQAPTRVFQIMRPAVAFEPNMSASDAVVLSGDRHVIVAHGERLVGIAPLHALQEAPAGAELGEVAENPIFLIATQLTDHASELVDRYGDGPIPVVDTGGRLVGAVTASALAGP